MIAVTGAAGFLGSALVWHFNAEGRDDLLLVDALGGDDRFRNLSGLSFADYLDREELLARIEGEKPPPEIEAMVHLGACSSTTEGDAAFLMRNNFAYTRSLARWCLARGVRFVYASSAATYGDGEGGWSDAPEALAGLRPLNAYAFSKHAFDLWARHHGALGQIAGLKYFNVFGPNEYHKGEMRSMALRAFEQIQAGGPVRLFKSERAAYADGEQERDFIYVKDAVRMTAWFVEHHNANGIFNIGAGVARSWNALARAVFAALGRPAAIEYFEMPEALRERYQYSTRAPLDRLRSAGGPEPQWTLAAAVEDYVVRYLAPGRRRLQDAAATETAAPAR